MKTDLRIFQSLFVIVWILIIVFLTCFNVDAQDICKNRYGAGTLIYAGLKQNNTIVYITAQIVDKGLGVRVDRDINKDIALYGSASYGNYWTMGMYGKIPHQKYAFGIIYCNNTLPLVQPRLTAGVSYHATNADSWEQANPNHVYDWTYYLPSKEGKVSCELGVGIVISRWVAVGFRYDIFRHESNADLGISFRL